MGAVIVLGSLMTDLVARAPRLPLPGESLLGDAFGIFAGGKGFNQAVAAARLGAHVHLIGRVGQDSFGETFLAALAAEGIERAHVTRDAVVGTGASVLMLGGDGQNAIVATPRANSTLTVAHVEAAMRDLPLASGMGGAVFLTQCETPLATVAVGLRLARVAGLTTLLNAAPIPREPLSDALLALADLLVVNETEAEALAGMAVATSVTARGAAARLLVRGPRQVVITLGARGHIWCGSGEDGDPMDCVEMPAFAVTAVDVTAAGDAFCGALAAALAAGRPRAEALRRASAAGALATTRMGALPSLPTTAAVEALLARQP
ncbi:MAG: ribokinase [Ktedonobacterales bacterium]|nr:ribokinase [Ktedonobacterales bacterium]